MCAYSALKRGTDNHLFAASFNAETIHSVSFMPRDCAALVQIALSDALQRAWICDAARSSYGFDALLGLPVNPCFFLSMSCLPWFVGDA